MKNEDPEASKILLSFLLGGVVGAGIAYAIRPRNHKAPVVQKIGKTISELGDMLERCNLSEISNIEKKIPKGMDVVNNTVDWLSQGLSLWKTLKKG